MDSILRLLSVAASIPIFGNGVMFMFDPETATRQLGMPLLEGISRSTQIGDFGSFFCVHPSPRFLAPGIDHRSCSTWPQS